MGAGLSLFAACAQQPAQSADPAQGTSEAQQALSAFPPAEPGYQRHVILLPQLADEDAHKVELIGGKTLAVDCNLHGMDGQFSQHDVPGWGYTWWQLQSAGQVRSTMMMCPDNARHDTFVRAESVLIRYNSRLPVVVAVPEGMQLRYRIWQAGAEQDAPEG